MITVLIVEDQPENRQLYEHMVSGIEKDLGLVAQHILAEDYESAHDALEFGRSHLERSPSLVLLDMELPVKGYKDARAGLRILEEYRVVFPDAYWIPVTGSVAWHVEPNPGERPLFDDLYRLEPFDVYSKGQSSTLEDIIQRALRLLRQVQNQDSQATEEVGSESAVRVGGTSYIMTDYRLYYQIRTAAEDGRNVILFGEPGTGKSLTATLIHQYSGRRSGPFYSIDGNLDAEDLNGLLFGSRDVGRLKMPEPLLEQAQGGTIYIKDFDNLGRSDTEGCLQLQRRLLHFLRYRRYDVRVIAGINKARRGFPLFDRILADFLDTMIPVDLPPLRERKSDLGALVEAFVVQFNQERERRGDTSKHIADSSIVRELLERKDWRQGNIAQLRLLVEEVLLKSPGVVVTAEDFKRVLEESSEEPVFGTLDVINEQGERRIVKITKPPLVTDDDLRRLGSN